ncbi:N-acetylglucosamine kinase [Sphingomonas oligoaromativorans]|uniref:N-acetylglucosamine kinase n=1 Tax=Sphingomonas oligoaromativorans TaxID=575322 RepID=UPI0014200EA5|nr:BadF/BadG/BcrA/BcrD ATPase family protein [Sphingomonas oligoaromativorans]NIJ33330.1 N-acetylglucosamine kinase-like BadF-type ATPase [Sphingomonas oligoaromativorans]
MSVFLGVDGGGTKTEFVCIDEAGRVIARAVTGTTYHLQIGLDEAIARLGQGIEAVCGQLTLSPAGLRRAFFGLPAFGEDAAIDPLLDAACGRLLGHDRYRCDNDMVCGWAGSLACADGINLVAGTGSIGYGERQGRKARVGGWGEIFGDEGSAYWIAIQGLNAFTRMSDGRLPAGPLKQALARELALASDLDICARVMGEKGMARDEIAGLARIVSDAADQGDAEAAAILDRAGSELAAMAQALRRNLGFGESETVLLSWSGGVLTKQATVRTALRRHLDRQGHYAVIEPRHDPALGAALYAALLDRASPA